jgi:hypothetical protein
VCVFFARERSLSALRSCASFLCLCAATGIQHNDLTRSPPKERAIKMSRCRANKRIPVSIIAALWIPGVIDPMFL